MRKSASTAVFASLNYPEITVRLAPYEKQEVDGEYGDIFWIADRDCNRSFPNVQNGKCEL